MAGKIEIIVGLVDKTDKGVGGTYASTSLIDQYHTNKNGFELVSQSSQTGVAVVAAVTSIVQLTKGFVPFLNVQTNAVAGTMVFLKITAQYKEKGTFDEGDLVSLVGNVTGVVAGITLLVGSGSAASVFIAAGVGASVYGIVKSQAMSNLFNSMVLPIWNQYFRDTPNVSYQDYWVAPDLKLVPLAEIIATYRNQIAVSHWDPRVDSVTLSSGSYHDDVTSDTGLGGDVIQGGGIPFPPLTIPKPERPIENIEISIESINGQSTQDGYGCVSGTQDGYH